MPPIWSMVAGALVALVIIPSRGAALPAESRAATIPQVVAEDTLVLSLQETQRRALQQNPAFLAERRAESIARGELRQARIYSFNPSVDLEAFEAGAPGQPRAYAVALSQDIQWAGQPGLRAGAARAGVARAVAGVHDVARVTAAEASHAFYAALAARRHLEVTTQISAANARLRAATRIQLQEGEISVLEANLAEIEFGRGRARVLTAQRETASALLALRRLVGVTPARPIRLVDTLPPPPAITGLTEDSLVALAMARRPDLVTHEAARRQFETLGRLARRDAIPTLRLTALATSDAGEDASRLGLGVGLQLPLWNRNQGVVAQREAEAEQAALRRQAAELQVRAEVAEAYRTYRAASDEAHTLETTVLEPARRNQTLLEAAYRAGKVGLPTLLLLRNQLLDAELDYWHAWLAHRQALVQLESAIAEPIVPAISGLSDETDREPPR